MSADGNMELQGEVRMIDALAAVIRVERRARQQQVPRFELDCSKARYFTGHALAELAIAKRKLRASGSDLCLVNCSEEIVDGMRVPIFQALTN